MNARAFGSALAVLVGAVAYASLVGGGVVGFEATPMILGLTAIAAGLAGTRRRVVGTGLVLAGWGSAVLLVAHGVVPGERTTPAYMLGIGIGMVVAALAAPKPDRGDWLTSGSIAAVTGPLSLYGSYDASSLGRWPLWAAVLVVWAAWEGFWGWREAPAHPASAAAQPA